MNKWTSITGWAVGAAALSGAVFHQQAAVLYTNTAAWIGSALERSSAYQAPAGTYPGPVHVKILSNSTEPVQKTQKTTTATKTAETTKAAVDNTVKATASQPAPTTSQPVSSASQSAQQTATKPAQTATQTPVSTQSGFTDITVVDNSMSGTTSVSYKVHTGTSRLTFYSPVGTVYTPLTWEAGNITSGSQAIREQFFNPFKPYERLSITLMSYVNPVNIKSFIPSDAQNIKAIGAGGNFYMYYLPAVQGRGSSGAILSWQAGDGRYSTFMANGYAEWSQTGVKTHPTSVSIPGYPGGALLTFGWTK